MTAPVTTDARVDLMIEIAEALRLLGRAHSKLHHAQYADVTQLSVDRAKLTRTVEWAGEVAMSLSGLGTDPEARD